MGLDGISINQLRITPEGNSAELNSQIHFNSGSGIRAVDGLNQGQKIDPDQEREKEKQQGGFNSSNQENADSEEEIGFEAVETIKYDLSKSDKYVLKLDDASDDILIVEKATKNVIQRFSPSELSNMVNFLSSPQGSIVNKRY